MNTDLVKPALSGAIGTTCMTLFSIITSEKKKRQFREYEILTMLLKEFPVSKSNRVALGWIAHYLTGIAFNVANQKLLKLLKTKPTLLNGILLGVANGIIGIVIWKTIFKIHPSPPAISLNRYLPHLMLAHLIFGAFSNVSMRGSVEGSPKTLKAY